MIPSVRHVFTMSPYALAQFQAPPDKPLISLSQNESLRPPSPRAIAAATKALGAGHMYPDPDWGQLRAGLSDLHGVPVERILCGNGSMELIASLTQAFADEHNAVLAPTHAYPFFRTAAQLARARFDVAEECEGRVSVDALLASVNTDTRIVFVANPGNPTGTRIPRPEVARLRDGLRQDILLVLDEAYGEFADHLNEPMFDLVERGNTIVLRTFSKAYGLAGLRIGWGLFPPEIAREVRKVMNPNNISVAGQAAANAALMDQSYMLETCRKTSEIRDRLRTRLQLVGYNVPESFTNFLLIRMGTPEAARIADQTLRAEGVFLRPQGGAGLADCLRITIGEAPFIDLATGILERFAEKEVI